MSKPAMSRAPSATAPARLFPDLDRLLSEDDAAKFLSLSKDTLRRRFRDGTSPPRVRLGRRVGYRLSDLHNSTSRSRRRQFADKTGEAP